MIKRRQYIIKSIISHVKSCHVIHTTGDNKTQAANKCLLKVAVMASADDEFMKAGDIFESIGRGSMDTRWVRYWLLYLFYHCVLLSSRVCLLLPACLPGYLHTYILSFFTLPSFHPFFYPSFLPSILPSILTY